MPGHPPSPSPFTNFAPTERLHVTGHRYCFAQRQQLKKTVSSRRHTICGVLADELLNPYTLHIRRLYLKIKFLRPQNSLDKGDPTC